MTIPFSEFQNVDLRVGKILSAEPVEGSEKLVKLSVDIGEEQPRQIVAGIGKQYTPDTLVGYEIAIVANLEPRQLMGTESQGMLLAAHDENELPVILMPERGVPPGSKIS